MDDEINLKEYIGILFKHKMLIFVVVVIVTFIAFFMGFSKKPIYAAEVSILMRGSGEKLSGQYTEIAGRLGIKSSRGNLTDLTTLLNSRAVAMKVLDDLDLTKRIKGWDAAGLKRESMASAISGMIVNPIVSGNLVQIRAEADDPQLAAEIANAYVKALSYYWNKLNYTEAQKKLDYIDVELPRIEKDLKKVEKKLKLVPRSTTGFSFGKQVGISSLQRDYEIYNSIYVMLKKEKENAKLEASKDIMPFSVIDKALVPAGPFKPNIKFHIQVGFILGIFLGSFLAFVVEYWKNEEKSNIKRNS